MRLIDADALETKAKTIYMEFENVAVPSRVIPFSELHLAPTIDAEPARHGRWIPETYSISKCSMCEQHHFAHVESWKYCPNCGAKMRGDEDAAE